MKPLRTAAVSSLLLVVGAAVTPLPCQAPTKLEQIAIYPGAARQPDRERELFGPAEASRTGRVFRVHAPIEEVARFYLQRLQAREIRTEAERDRTSTAIEELSAGQATGVTMYPEFVDLTPAHFAETAGAGDDPARLAAAWRGAYGEKRTPFRPNAWLQSATFSWGVSPGGGQRVAFDLSVDDVGAWQIRESSYQHETDIVINMQSSGPAAAEEGAAERAPAAPLAAPPESELGVPLYPGARFDGRMSAALSGGDDQAKYYVYTSADAPAQITTFYERRTGKIGQGNQAGALIVVRGEGLFPDLGVTVQPNPGSYPSSVKAVITIRKRR